MNALSLIWIALGVIFGVVSIVGSIRPNRSTPAGFPPREPPRAT